MTATSVLNNVHLMTNTNSPAPIVLDADGAVLFFNAPVPADLTDYDLGRDLRGEATTATKIQLMRDYDNRR